MVWEKLTVKNLGNLALKYVLSVNVTDISKVGQKSLADVLKVAVMDTQPTRDNVPSAATECLATFNLASDNALAPGASEVFYVAIYWAPSANYNDYNVGGEELYANLGVTLLATQFTYEKDCIDDQYDKDASLDDVKIEKTIDIKEDITESINVAAHEDATINMNAQSLLNKLVNNGEVEVNNGKISITNNATDVSAVGFSNYGDATLNNVNMEVGSASDYGNILYAGSTTEYNDVEITSNGGGVGVTDGAKATFNSGSVYVDSTSTSGRYLFYVVGNDSELTINDGTFSWDPADNQKRAYIYVGSGATVYVNGGTFGPASTRSGYTEGILGSGTVIITGGTFGFDPSAWVSAGYVATQNGSTWTVSAE